MIQGRKRAAARRVLWRSKRMQCAFLALATAILVVGTACDEEEAGRAFREAAVSSVQEGVNSIMDGVIDGMFAVFEMGVGESDGTSSSDTSSTSTE